MNKLLFVLVIIIYGCTSENKKEVAEQDSENTASTVNNDSIRKIELENKAVALVDTINEVSILANEIKINSKDKNHLTIWIAAEPEETQINYYWIKVGEDNGLNIATHYNFYVDPVRESILYYDIVNDTLITLEDWRKK